MWVEITETPIELEKMIAHVSDPSIGAIATFTGVVRNHNLGREVLYLEYECYRPMALKSLQDLAQQIRSKWDIHDIALLHRIGRLEIGEASVMIAISSAHRKEGLLAVHDTIDTLKETTPIWKKEYWEGGDMWVEGCQHP